MTRSVLVTGGNRGLGLAVAQRFLASGDHVAATYRGTPPTAGILALKCDVGDRDQVDGAFATAEETHGPVEVLVVCAGITVDRLAARMSDEDFTRVLDTNLTGAFRAARRAVPSMLRRRGGRMIFVSSVNGLSGNAGQVNYAASKAGLIGLARSLARELGPVGVTANVVAPGYARTDMTAQMSAKSLEMITQRVPLGRLASASDVAATIEFLAGDGAAYITGAVIPVDGGLGMGH